MNVRVAVISTPRAGNTWLRQLLMDAYGIAGLAVHNPEEIDWSGLPAECVLQIHWPRTSSFLQTLKESQFRVVTLVRHPLDVLISILQFCLRDASTQHWLSGAGGDEQSIYGAMPGSAAFVDYATGPRAAALVNVSRDWWPASDSCRVRYEELVANTSAELQRITTELGEPARYSVAEVAEGATMPRMRERTGVGHHFWQGRPGLWKLLLTAPIAQKISQTHADCFRELGYRCDADPELTASQTDANWVALHWSPFAARLQQDAVDRLAARETICRLEERCRDLESQTQRAYQAHEQLHAEHVRLLDCYNRLGPSMLRIIAKVRTMMHRHPTVVSAVRRVFRLRRSA